MDRVSVSEMGVVPARYGMEGSCFLRDDWNSRETSRPPGLLGHSAFCLFLFLECHIQKIENVLASILGGEVTLVGKYHPSICIRNQYDRGAGRGQLPLYSVIEMLDGNIATLRMNTTFHCEIKKSLSTTE